MVASHFRRRALEQAWEEVMAGQPEPCCDSVETQYLILESLLAVWKALDGLSLRTRQIFLMAQIDGLSHKEIAAQLGVTANAVQKAVARGLEQCYFAVYDFS
ncbi:RNA polymerase sigma factor (sigma-70 family) [Kerstersia gyiorum]|uniref:sigma factor-like helix-turn-helix DNA-binding protein n=1 Tax=Kerstersia gyiorum TaxID=206506 RepID=UPI0039F665A4|nr:RNA polymerase sigma factor (sigma-70 family) [Kerstersia gyiorum]